MWRHPGSHCRRGRVEPGGDRRRDRRGYCPGFNRSRRMIQSIPVVEKSLSANDRLAEHNRTKLDSAGVFSYNLMASPGAGKTSLIERTIAGLAGRRRVAGIDGDIATSIDADRARAARA